MSMRPDEVLLAVVSWVHLLAAISWLGGGIFYLVALRPALRAEPPDHAASLTSQVAERFRGAVELAIVVLLVSGVVLTFQRLTAPQASGAYAAVLGLKITLSVAMFTLAYWLGRRGAVGRLLDQAAEEKLVAPRGRWRLSPAIATVLLGAAVTLLAELLRVLFRP